MALGNLAFYFPYLLDGTCMIVGSLLIYSGVLGTFISVPKRKSIATLHRLIIVEASRLRFLFSGGYLRPSIGDSRDVGAYARRYRKEPWRWNFCLDHDSTGGKKAVRDLPVMLDLGGNCRHEGPV